MDKRYQVFVSSTYADLKEERQKVIQALMEMDCIPSGMELFPAADEEQFEFIKKVIDDCDYYLLIIGGRYGSVAADGISYTEKEYEYALERGIKVVALLHEDPSLIPAGKSEINETMRERLRVFREKVGTGRLVKFWNSADQLPGLVALSLSKTIKTHPAVGWIRADRASSEEVLSEVNDLHKENARLKQEIRQYVKSAKPEVENLASLDEIILVHLTYYHYGNSSKTKYNTEVEVTWRKIFALVAPYLIPHPNDVSVSSQIAKDLFKLAKKEGSVYDINDQDFQTIKLQLKALGLINVEYSQTTGGGMGLFWSLTSKGEALMLQLRTVRAAS